jgi:hypothetical protein
MKRILMSAAFTGLIAVGSYAVAQSDPPQSAQPAQSTAGGTDYSNSGSSNKAETMKQCMARQKATNSGLTHEAMQTTCKNEMRQQKLQQQGQDLATGTQNGSQTQPKD